LTHTLVAEPHIGSGANGSATGRLILQNRHAARSGAARPGDTLTSHTYHEGRETHRHDYTRLPGALGDELGGFSTLLGLFASPPLIPSTESVVAMEWHMEWKVMSTSIAIRAASPGSTSVDAGRKRNKRALLGPMSSD